MCSTWPGRAAAARGPCPGHGDRLNGPGLRTATAHQAGGTDGQRRAARGVNACSSSGLLDCHVLMGLGSLASRLAQAGHACGTQDPRDIMALCRGLEASELSSAALLAFCIGVAMRCGRLSHVANGPNRRAKPVHPYFASISKGFRGVQRCRRARTMELLARTAFGRGSPSRAGALTLLEAASGAVAHGSIAALGWAG